MSATVTQITTSPKLRGRPLGGWGHYIDANGTSRWLCKTAEGAEAAKRFHHITESGWWARMSARDQAAFHRWNSEGLGADAARDYRTYVEFVEVRFVQDNAGGKAHANNKTPSGANR